MKITAGQEWEKHIDASDAASAAHQDSRAEAEARKALEFVRAFPQYDGRRAETLVDIGDACLGQGRYADAIVSYRKAVAALEASPYEDKTAVADVLAKTVIADAAYGQEEDAVRAQKQVDALDDAVLSPNNVKRVPHIAAKADLAIRQRRYAQARDLFKQTETIYRANGIVDSEEAAANMRAVAMTYLNEHNYAEAEPLLVKAIPVLIKTEGKDSPTVGKAIGDLADIYTLQHRYDKAEPLYRKSISVLKGRVGPKHPSVGVVMRHYARMLDMAHRPNEAAANSAQAADIPRVKI